MLIAERVKELPASLSERTLIAVHGGQIVVTRIIYDEFRAPCDSSSWVVYSDLPVSPERLATWIEEGAL